ncbi:MAG: phosphoglycerate dehydrogenase [Acidobacteria bacterium]|nr:phosphoglycerate dehydrogenase [Acidobacteriota bacterium]
MSDEQKFRVLVTDTLGDAGLQIFRNDPQIELDYQAGVKGEDLLTAVARAHALVTRSGTPVTADLLDHAKELRVLARAGVGLDNVDITGATERGILVINTPTANIISATEHTMAMMLSLLRDIPAADASLRRGEWKRSSFMGRELSGKTLGIIGFGRIGSRVAVRAKAFGATLLAHDPYIPAAVAKRVGAEPVDLDQLIEQSDIITVHTPLGDETRGMLGRDEIARMKKGAIVLNIARGGIYDEVALAEALVNGHLAGAAIDVFESEPPAPDHPLLLAPNVYVTPHLGANTTEAQERVATQTARMTVEALRGSLLVSAVNLPFEGETDNEGVAFARLAEKLGLFASQILDGPCDDLNLSVRGVDEKNVRLMMVAALRGIMLPHLSETVNFVNAEAVAQRRGMEWSSTIHQQREDYLNLVTLTARSGEHRSAISGTLFHASVPRVVTVNDFYVEFEPRGWVIYLVNKDVPGVVGKVGTILGDRDINIGEYNLARSPEGGRAMAIISIDEPLDRGTIEFLRSLKEVEDIRMLKL